MITMKDIALLAGVSQQAVSAALNGNGHSRVSVETRDKVRKIARELHYVPNAAARMLAGGNSRTIGILGTPTGGLQGELLREVFAILESRGYKALLTAYGWPEFSAASALSEIAARGVDGIIVFGWDAHDDPKLFSALPVVRLGGAPELSDVAVDPEATGLVGTSHLLDHGHGKVHLLRVNANGKGERAAGWLKAHAARGVAAGEDDIIDLRKLDGLASRLVEVLQKKRVTALFCHNDYIALKVLRVCLEHGIRVPEDIALVGCDGRSFTESGTVGIATVIQPIQPVAETAVELLFQRIEAGKSGEPAGMRIAPLFHPARSCGCSDSALEQLYRINTMEFLETDNRLNFNRNLLEGE